MHILFLTPQLPYPPRQGTALRNYHLIRGLAEQHTISLLSFHESEGPADLGPLATLCRQAIAVSVPGRTTRQRLLNLMWTRRPDMALRLWSQPFADHLTEWLRQERFDVVQIEGIEMAPYLEVIERTSPGYRPLIVFDDHNAEYVLQQRAFETDLRIPQRWHAAAYSLLQWRRLGRFEADVCRRADRVIAVSQADRDALIRLVPGLEIAVIPNCIDTDAQAAESATSVAGFTVLFVGKMDYRPNIDAALWFGRQIWPRIKAARPNATWGIVGKSPHQRLDPLRQDPSITVVGEVPEVLPYLQAAEVYVIPLRMGAGTRFKLLEALAAGVPVVSTRVGAEGVPVQSERDLLLADEPDTFARAVLRLLEAPNLGRRLGAAGRTLVRQQFDWRSVVPRLEAIYGAAGPSRADGP